MLYHTHKSLLFILSVSRKFSGGINFGSRARDRKECNFLAHSPSHPVTLISDEVDVAYLFYFNDVFAAANGKYLSIASIKTPIQFVPFVPLPWFRVYRLPRSLPPREAC